MCRRQSCTQPVGVILFRFPGRFSRRISPASSLTTSNRFRRFNGGRSPPRSSHARKVGWEAPDRRSAIELIEDALNLRVPTVYDHDPDTDRDAINGSATEAARDKQEKLKKRFKPWLWQDDERRERLALFTVGPRPLRPVTQTLAYFGGLCLPALTRKI